MSSSALRTFALLLLVVAAVFGVLAYYMNGRLADSPDTSANEPMPAAEQTLAVVAIRPLSAYRKVTAEDVALVPISVEPPQFFTDPAAVIGRTPIRGVATGAPVTETAFGGGSTLAGAIPPGTQAMSLSISDVIAVGGFVQPGDFVDVLVYLRSSGEQVADSQARILLRKARVLAYQEQLITEDASNDQGGERGRRERTAVLAVPQAETTRVMLGASLGELRLALRGTERHVNEGDDMDSLVARGERPAMPEAIAPASVRVPVDNESSGDGGNGDDQLEPQVVTLSELARIENQQKTPARAPAPRRRSVQPRTATIELFEGAKSSRISRPY
ncbi:Flp pilus assembly protein CpaB [Salinisphaera sp. T31B1]|uniref:Flp pilus assembly protein CpaB n=1 Tax=Salinisphaera sp. T31B1 TaxID=727963 RepID=UPI00333EA332